MRRSVRTGTVLLSEGKSFEKYDCLQKTYPFTPWSRIDWGNVSSKIVIENVNEIVPLLSQTCTEDEEYVFILWSYGNSPVLQTQLHIVIKALEEVLAVSPDTFIYSPGKYVIEFHHDGEVTIGFEN